MSQPGDIRFQFLKTLASQGPEKAYQLIWSYDRGPNMPKEVHELYEQAICALGEKLRWNRIEDIGNKIEIFKIYQNEFFRKKKMVSQKFTARFGRRLNIKLPRRRPRRIIAISHFGVSGSYFLSSLFDMHPDLLSIPYGLQRFPIYSRRVLGGPVSLDTWLGMVLSPPDHGGLFFLQEDYDDQVRVDRHHFTSFFEIIAKSIGYDSSSLLSEADIFWITHLAYNNLVDGPIPDDPKVILFQLHTFDSDKFDFLKVNFSSWLIVCMVREPLRALASGLLNHPAASQRTFGQDFLTTVVAMECVIQVLNPDDRSRFIAVPLETLKSSPEETTRILARRLNINWHSSFMSSTANGRPFEYRSGSRAVSGFSTKNLVRDYSQYIGKFDEFVLSTVFRTESSLWGYQEKNQKYDSCSFHFIFRAMCLTPLKFEIFDLIAAVLHSDSNARKEKIRQWLKCYRLIRHYLMTKHAHARDAQYYDIIIRPLVLGKVIGDNRAHE